MHFLQQVVPILGGEVTADGILRDLVDVLQEVLEELNKYLTGGSPENVP